MKHAAQHEGRQQGVALHVATAKASEWVWAWGRGVGEVDKRRATHPQADVLQPAQILFQRFQNSLRPFIGYAAS